MLKQNFFFNIILDFFYPEFCIKCNYILDSNIETCICRKCSDKIFKFSEPEFYCYKCGKQFFKDYKVDKENLVCKDCRYTKRYFEFSRHLFDYTGYIKQLILLYKYHNKRSLSDTFAELIIKYLKLNYFEFEFDFIINVPVYDKNKFNHIDLLCQKISKKSKIEYKKDFVIKSVKTENQQKLKKKERLLNLKNAFKINNYYTDNFDKKNILIIDDVYTTGTTLNEISKTIKHKYKNVKIKCLTLARGL